MKKDISIFYASLDKDNKANFLPVYNYQRSNNIYIKLKLKIEKFIFFFSLLKIKKKKLFFFIRIHSYIYSSFANYRYILIYI